jgi:hypothetical protein
MLASEERWLKQPPQRTAYFSSARQPGVVLRVSTMRTPVPRRRRRSAGSVAMPEPLQKIERRALGREQ